MADDSRSHRQFHVYAVAGAGAGEDDPDALTDEEAEKAVGAYTWPEFAAVRLFPRADFGNYATPFEHAHSSLLGQGKWRADPVVDANGEVIMHVGWFDWAFFEIPTDLASDLDAAIVDSWPFDPAQMWKFQIVVSDAKLAPGISYAFHPEMVYLVLTTTDGTVMQVLDKNSGQYGDMSTIQPLDVIFIVKFIAALGLAGIEYLAAEETLAALGTARLVGRVSADEMEAHLARILGKNNELRRLMAARVLSGPALRAEVRSILGQWAKQSGKQIEELSTEEMKQVTSPENLMTLQPPGIRSKLLINKALLDPGAEREFFDQAAHELTADALGWSGKASADNMAFVGDEFRSGINTAQTFLENAVKYGRDIADQLQQFRVDGL